MKRTSLILLLIVLLSMVGNKAYASVRVGDLYYILDYDNKTAQVTRKTNGKYSGNITIPSQIVYNFKQYSVTSIGGSAFYKCLSLTSITIPSSVTSIEPSAFEGSSNLTSITVGTGVTSIGDNAFNYCSGLTSVTIPNSVTSIGKSAFQNCLSLTSITIGTGVTSIGSYAFKDCSKLEKVIIEDLSAWCVIEFDEISSNPLSCAKHLYANKNTEIVDLKIPDGVTTVSAYAFYGCSSLTSVTIPNSVTSIGKSAFSGCSGLISVTIGNGVTSVESSAFSGCKNITELNFNCPTIKNWFANIKPQIKTLTLGDSVTSIGDYAFSGCSGLTSITIPNSVTSIGGWAFSGCSGLTSITIPNSVTSIGERAFQNCSGLTSVTIPNSVTDMGGYPFSGCSGLTSIVVESGNTQFDSRENCNAIIETASNKLLVGCKKTVIPNSVTSIGSDAFYGCSGLYSVTIPNSVTSIGNSAFKDCSDLAYVTIGNSVKSIGNSTFSGCSRLISITIPNSVTSIGGSAFHGCLNLTSVTIGSGVTSVGSGVFGMCLSIKTLNLDCPTIGKWFEDFYNESINTLIIGNNVKRIGDAAFKDCYNLTSLTIGNNVTSIGNQAFMYCKRLTSITIPDSVISIGEGAFYYCSSLTSITIPNSVTSIGNSAFKDCSGLTSITIGNSVTSIGASAFLCSHLISVTALNPTPVAITENVFSNRKYAILYVPKGSKEVYQAADYWKEFNKIEEISLPTHKLAYMVDGEEYKSYDIEEGESIIPEEDPTKEGYTFSGWSAIPATMPAHDVTITGTFSINSYKLIYTVDGQEYKSTTVEYGATITPESAPTKEGYTFSGWSEIPATMPAHDVTVTGTFSINSYKLTYMIDNEVYKNVTYEYGATITPEPTPEGNYATFEWTDLPQTMPAHDVVVHATYTTGITDILKDNQQDVKVYSPNGKMLAKPEKGINIIRMKDGTTKKIVVK